MTTQINSTYVVHVISAWVEIMIVHLHCAINSCSSNQYRNQIKCFHQCTGHTWRSTHQVQVNVASRKTDLSQLPKWSYKILWLCLRNFTWQWKYHKEEERSHDNGTITRKRKDHVAILAQKSNLCITWTHLITVTVDLYRTTSEKEIICLN